MTHGVGGLLSKVAPVRERGLKLPRAVSGREPVRRRSRKGAWIEIISDAGTQ